MRFALQACCGVAESAKEGKGLARLSRPQSERKEDRHMDDVQRDPDYTARRFVTTAEAMQILQCSRPVASRAIHVTNERLKKQGYFTVTGRCNRQAFFETLGYKSRLQEG